MPKQAKKAPKAEEYENSDSEQIESAASEENVSGAEESDEDEEEAPALDASATESDEDDEEVNADDDDEEEESDEDEEGDEKMEANDDSEDEDEEKEDDNQDEEDDDDSEEVDDDEDVPTAKTLPKAGDKKKKQPADKKKPAPKPAELSPEELLEKVKNQVRQIYDARRGLQLFIRFPEKLPEYEELQVKVKELSPLVTKVHKPRQNHARFCLVDFANQDDRDKTFEELSATSEKTKLVVSLPRYEQEGYIEKIAEKKFEHIAVMRARKLLKKQAQKSAKEGNFTSNIVVYNIPKSASLPQIKELFPDAVDIQIKQAPKKFIGVCTAVVTCNSTQSARKNQKRKLTLGGNSLFIRFDKKNKKEQEGKADGETPAEKSGKQPKPVLGKKRLSDGDGDEPVAEKKAKVAKPQKKQKQQQNGDAKKTTPAAKPPQKKQKQKLNGNAEETPAVATEEKTKAKPPQKKQKQKLNGSAAEEKPVAKKQAQPLKGKPAKANGNSPQKKGGVAKPKPAGKSPLKTQKPAKKAKVAK